MADLSIYSIVAFILIATELLYFKIANKYSIIDKPNQRSSHIKPTIRGGGIIFYLGTIVWGVFFNGFSTHLLFLLGLILIGGISFIDDIHSIPNRYRIVFHLFAIILLLVQCNELNFSGWTILFTFLAVIVSTGIINAFNFMDGINGMTGAYSLSVLIPLLYLNKGINFTCDSLIVVTIISILVFCYFNFRKKARCFAGDVGSISIAYIIIFIIGSLIVKTHHIFYIMFLAVYGIDSIMTIIHRIYLHENIFKAHRKHAYQLLANELKMPHLAVSSIYFIIQISINFGLIILEEHKIIYCIIVLLLLSVIYWVLINRFFYLHIDKQSMNNSANK